MTALPTVRWREPGDVSVLLQVPPSGVFLGMDAESAPVLLPAIGPRLTRVGVVGDWRIAALLAYRLLGVGCLLTTLTDDPGRWRHLLDAAGTRGTVGRSGAAWPAVRADGCRQVLVSDLPAPPDPPGTGVPGTVVHDGDGATRRAVLVGGGRRAGRRARPRRGVGPVARA